MSHCGSAARYSGASAIRAAWMSPSRCRSSKAWARRPARCRRSAPQVLRQRPSNWSARRAYAGGGPCPGGIRGDADERSLRSLARGVGVQRAEDADEHFLSQVLGVMAVAGQAVGEPVHPGRVVPDDCLPGGRRPRRRGRVRISLLGTVHCTTFHRSSHLQRQTHRREASGSPAYFPRAVRPVGR